MFLDGHELDGIIAQVFNPGKDIFGELGISAEAFLFLRHTHMAFVNKQFTEVSGIKIIILPVELSGKPDLPGEILGILILHGPGDIGRDVVPEPFVGIYQHFDLAAMRKSILVLLFIQEDLPDAEIIFLQRMGKSVPVVEVAGQVKGIGLRGPFAVSPAFPFSIVIDPEILISVGKFFNASEIP